jgi:hypothetical protein
MFGEACNTLRRHSHEGGPRGGMGMFIHPIPRSPSHHPLAPSAGGMCQRRHTHTQTRRLARMSCASVAQTERDAPFELTELFHSNQQSRVTDPTRTPLSMSNIGRCHASRRLLSNLQQAVISILLHPPPPRAQNFRKIVEILEGVMQKFGRCRNVE